jgi:hypothetical protein
MHGVPYASQHPYLADRVGAPYVCSYRMGQLDELRACVRGALETDLPPFVPLELRHDAYVQRLREIFGGHIAARR